MLSYILLDVERKSQEDIKEKLLRFKFTVDRVNKTNGKYNIIARIITDNKSSLNNFISEQLNPLEEINKIETIIV